MRNILIVVEDKCLQCIDAVGWAAGRASVCKKTKWWSAGVVTCLQQGANYAYDPADATATHCLLLQQNLDWFYLPDTGSPG